MPTIKGRYSFAKKYLRHLNSKLFVNGRQVLQDDGLCPYEINRLRTLIPESSSFLEEESIVEIKMSELDGMGFVVTKETIPKELRWDYKSRTRYLIKPKGSRVLSLDNLPKGCKLLFDQKNRRIRGVGNGFGSSSTRPDVGDWVYLKDDANPNIIFDAEGLVNDLNTSQMLYDASSDAAIVSMGGYLEPNRGREIPECPFMVTTEGEIVCIERRADMQNIGITGDRGTGKTLLEIKLLVEFFYKFTGDWCCVLNDGLGLFHANSEPMKTDGFVKSLRIVGEEPISLPVVIFYVGCEDIVIDKQIGMDGIGFVYVISAKSFYERDNYLYFTNGIDGTDLGGPIRYLPIFAPHFRGCKSGYEIMRAITDNWDLIVDKLDAKKTDGIKSMIFKWDGSIGISLKLNFLDVCYEDPLVCSVWEVKRGSYYYKGDPVICCMMAGVVPVMDTFQAKVRPHCRNVVSSVNKKIWDYQSVHKSDGQRIWIFYDELGDIIGMGRKVSDNLTKEFITMFKQGRNLRIGCVYNTQSFTELPKDVVQNTTTLISTQIRFSEGERTALQKAFNLPVSDKKIFAELNSAKREIVAVQRHPFVVYGRDGKKKLSSECRNFYRGYLIPPNCNTTRLKDSSNVKVGVKHGEEVSRQESDADEASRLL